MGIVKSPENSINKNLTELEKNLGIDLKINSDGDLILSNTNDLRLSVGAENAAQAIYIKTNIEPGALLYHPGIGVDLQIGSKTKNAFDIKTQLIKSLSKDERFDNIDVVVQVVGDTILIDLRVTLANTDIEVPFSFSVTG